MRLIFVGGEDVSARIEISYKLKKLGYNIKIVGSQEEEIFRQNNIEYEKYFLNRELNLFDDIKTILQLRKILKKEKEAIVHAFDTKPTMFLPIAAIGLKHIKVVRTITGMGRIFTENSLKNSLLKRIYNFIQRIFRKRVDMTIFQNEGDYKYFIENNLIFKGKGKVIKSSGINLERFLVPIEDSKLQSLKDELSLKYDTITFILISRVVKEKGILYYLDAAKCCYERGYKYNFLLVGQLDTDNSIKQEDIEKYKKYVKYLGRRSDIKELLAISDIFVLPTYYREGVPRVLLEASAMRLPIITTNMPGCKDVVEDEFNGKLVNIKDSHDLCEKMIYLAENKYKIKKMGLNAKKKVEEFSLENIVKEYNNVYNLIKG